MYTIVYIRIRKHTIESKTNVSFTIQCINMEFIVTNIKWDTDGEDIDLPKTILVNVNPEDLEDEDISDILADEISDRTGFCHYSFSYEQLK